MKSTTIALLTATCATMLVGAVLAADPSDEVKRGLRSKPPPQLTRVDSFVDLDPATMTRLLREGSLIIVRQKPDLSLINVTAAQLVKAPVEVAWAAVADFDTYPRFMPQCAGAKVVARADDRLVLDQTIEIKVWHLPSVSIVNQLAYSLEKPRRMRYWHVGGELPGTYGGWDFVESGGQTMIFYTVYSPLDTIGWGLGGVFKKNPDYMAGINVTTARMVVKAAKEEAERRAAGR